MVILESIASGEACGDGLESPSPVAARLPWPEALASQLALDHAGELPSALRGAWDDSLRNTLRDALAITDPISRAAIDAHVAAPDP